MRTVRMGVMMLVLYGVLFAGCLSAYADDRSLSAMFIKCDGLLGKSPKAVLAVLGQPDVATNKDLSGFRLQPLLLWQYKDHDPETQVYGYSIKLIFLPNHTLAFAGYDGLNAEGGTQPLRNLSGYQIRCKATLAQILRSYNASSLKIGYEENRVKTNLVPGQATTKIDSYNIIIEATSKNSNSFRTLCAVEAPNPLTISHNFDANSNVYKDTFSANADFKIDYIMPGNLEIFSPSTNKLKSLPHGLDVYQLCFQLASGNPDYPVALPIETSSTHFIPVSDKIMPWLNQSP